jgi:putative molybdopterin biosynthesis protein
VTDPLELIPGYGRSQGILFRRGDARFEGKSLDEIVRMVTAVGNEARSVIMVNRNQGSGTRILIDRLLQGARPPGYAMQPSNHNAVAAAIAQGRADWGLAIETVARSYGLGFVPYQDEQYDFVIPKTRRDRPAVQAFRKLLASDEARELLKSLGFRPSS